MQKKINKEENFLKQKPPDIKQIILASIIERSVLQINVATDLTRSRI